MQNLQKKPLNSSQNSEDWPERRFFGFLVCTWGKLQNSFTTEIEMYSTGFIHFNHRMEQTNPWKIKILVPVPYHTTCRTHCLASVSNCDRTHAWSDAGRPANLLRYSFWRYNWTPGEMLLPVLLCKLNHIKSDAGINLVSETGKLNNQTMWSCMKGWQDPSVCDHQASLCEVTLD